MRLIIDNAPLFWSAARITLLIFMVSTAVAGVIAIAFGGLATIKASFVRRPVRIAIEFVRDVPQIVSVFFVFFGAPALGIRIGPVEATMVSLSLWGGANGAEIVRGGLASVPRGQTEAALSLGMRPLQIFCLVVFPQALRPVLPALMALAGILLQSTALAALVGAVDLLKGAQMVVERATYFEGGAPGLVVYAFILCVYLAFGSVIATAQHALERRFSPHAAPAKP